MTLQLWFGILMGKGSSKCRLGQHSEITFTMIDSHTKFPVFSAHVNILCSSEQACSDHGDSYGVFVVRYTPPI